MKSSKEKGNLNLLSVFKRIVLPFFVLFVISAFALNQQNDSKKVVAATQTGKEIYENKCGKCHKLFEREKYDSKKWRKWVDKMAPMAKLDSEEKEKVYKYLTDSTKVK